MMSFKRPRVIGTLTLALALVAFAAPGVSHAQRTTAPIGLTFWTFVSNTDKVIAYYQQTHPGVSITWRNIPNGAYYDKLTTVLKAGAGAPDLAICEYDHLPQIEQTGSLVDLSKYGASAARAQFLPWAWSQVSQGNAVYAIPQDSGPMGLYYRADLFQKYHIAVPTTWAQFASAAAALHKADPALYITGFDPNDATWHAAMIWQAGGRLFQRAGNAWTVTINSPAALKVLSYWGDLVSKGLVKVEPHYSPTEYANWDKGRLATYVSAVWDQSTVSGSAADTKGKWRVAPLPQWGRPFTVGNWGGSTTTVTTQSHYPKEATAFAIWLNTDPHAYQLMHQTQGVWPVATALLHQPWLHGSDPFYGGQDVDAVFQAASATVRTDFTWGPQMTFTYNKLGANISAAARGQISYAAALAKTQAQVAGFMQAQGYTVR